MEDTGLHEQRGPWRLPRGRRLQRAVLSRIARWLGVKVLFIFSRSLRQSSEDELASRDGFDFKELSEADLLEFSEDPDLQFSSTFVRESLGRGDTCFGVLHRGRLVAYRWYAFEGPTPCDDGLEIRFASPGRAYGYKAFTDPGYRGRRLQDLCMRGADAALLRRGCTHAVGYIGVHNYSSLRAQSRAQALERLGYVAYLKAFGRAFVVSTSGVRRNRVSMGL